MLLTENADDVSAILEIPKKFNLLTALRRDDNAIIDAFDTSIYCAHATVVLPNHG